VAQGFSGVSDGESVERCAEHLALALENIWLRRCLNSKQLVNGAVGRVAQTAALGVPIDHVFRQFATEIEAMVEFQRLSLYLVSQESDLAICAFRTGEGVGRRPPEESGKLSSSGLEETATSGEPRIFSDLSKCDTPPVWNQSPASGMRSALLLQVSHRGVTVGLVLLEHRLPRAFESAGQTSLQEVAAALAPSMARVMFPNQPIGKSNRPPQDNVQRELAKILTSSQSFDEIFPRFVTVLNKAVRVDTASVSWIDPNGNDLRRLWASPCQGNVDPGSIPETGLSIEIPLCFKEWNIGVLTVFRRQGKRFSFQDQTILNQIGVQISPAVQAGRLYLHAKRQAFQLQGLSRVEMPPTDADSLTSLTKLLIGQMSDVGQAQRAAAFMYDQRQAGQSPMAGAIILDEDLPEGLMEELAGLADKCLDEGAAVRQSLYRRTENSNIGHYPAEGQSAGFLSRESWKCVALALT